MPPSERLIVKQNVPFSFVTDETHLFQGTFTCLIDGSTPFRYCVQWLLLHFPWCDFPLRFRAKSPTRNPEDTGLSWRLVDSIRKTEEKNTNRVNCSRILVNAIWSSYHLFSDWMKKKILIIDLSRIPCKAHVVFIVKARVLRP